MDEELLRRAEDLARRAERSGSVTHTQFLTPAQRYVLEHWRPQGADCALRFSGGVPDAERTVAFFLPDWMDPEGLEPGDWLSAIELTARFGAPGHRDVLGAVLGLGIEREWLGDILIQGEQAWLICLPSVKNHLLLSLDKVGRWGVKTREVPLSAVPRSERQVREESFTVKSLRLDAVLAGMFDLSRAAAAEAVTQGLVHLNYSPCLKTDAPVRAGDVISLRGKGKGTVAQAGESVSRRGRLVVRAEIAT